VCSSGRSSNEYGFSLSGESQFGRLFSSRNPDGTVAGRRRWLGVFSIDAASYPVQNEGDARIQLYVRSNLDVLLSDAWSVKIRWAERIRNWGQPLRSDIRMELTFRSGRILGSFRANVLTCKETGLLSYAEAGYKGNRFQAFLRQGVFAVDDWEDRIYVYERDAPGGYNVPAFYGRGVWTAFTAAWNISKCLKVYLRAACTSYPFMKNEKPGKAELKFQVRASF
jgi:hypothetical protein